MAENIYDEVEIEDMTYDPTLEIYHYPCPCGDRFEISIADLRDGEEIAVCPSCSLMIKVIFEVVSKDLVLATAYSMADLVVSNTGRSSPTPATRRTKGHNYSYSLNTRMAIRLNSSSLVSLIV